jgi:pyridoxal phosphate phosphatase PHOSPHO2
MKRGVRNLKDRKDIDTTFLCLSNSNQVYIDTILKVGQLQYRYILAPF